MWTSEYRDPDTQRKLPHLNINLQLPRLPAEGPIFDEVESMAAATAEQLAPVIVQHRLQEHYVILRLLLGEPGQLCQVRGCCLIKTAGQVGAEAGRCLLTSAQQDCSHCSLISGERSA